MGLDFLLEPISEESPCGVDLEYDEEFRLLEAAARGKPGSEVDPERPGASIAAIPPDWHETQSLAESVLRKSKDLRVAIYWLKAEIALHGLLNVAQALDSIGEMSKQYWEGLFPLLDPEDDNDPIMRVNALASLSDPEDALKLIRESSVFKHSAFGLVKFRSLETALGVINPSENSNDVNLTLSDAQAAVTAGLDSHSENLLAIRQCLEAARRLQGTIDELAGSRSSLDLKPLFQRLKPVADLVDSLSGKGAESGEGEGSDASSTGAALSGQLNRQEAKREILRICAFLEATEPSSPAPIFLRRAVALMDMNFLDIVRDLAPESVGTFEHYGQKVAVE